MNAMTHPSVIKFKRMSFNSHVGQIVNRERAPHMVYPKFEEVHISQCNHYEWEILEYVINCSSLRRIKVDFTDWLANYGLENLLCVIQQNETIERVSLRVKINGNDFARLVVLLDQAQVRELDLDI